ncbi:group 3 secretory phospholipase A2-like [Sardina pilchardus]|uniref:group 3 secretory phospholipase A2-like n=1 Tax=Sardina pilchardus TaxID=27697 RepID=UPI002E1597B1
MQVTARLPFVLTLAMFCPWVVSEAEILCFHAQSVRKGTQVSFLLGENGTLAKSLVLYSSIWNEDRQLVYCKTNENDVVIGQYLSLCRRRQNSKVVEISANSYNLSVIMGQDSPCYGRDTSISEKNDPQGTQTGRRTSGIRRRTKRAIIFPGTLWCGTGSKALEYEQLGMFEHTDRCCREHDHCSSVIHSFTVDFGVFNSNLFTVSHCDCDHRFRQCLMDVNDPISHMVGYSFFNILRLPCFHFAQRRHCSNLNWWGKCTEVEMAPYAVFQTQALYNATYLTSRTKDPASHHVTFKPSVKAPISSRVKPVSLPNSGKRKPVKGNTFHQKGKKTRKSQSRKAKKVTPSQSTTQSVTPLLRKTSLPSTVQTFPTVGDVNNTEKNASFIFNPQATLQPSEIPGKNTTMSQMAPAEKLRNPSSTRAPAASTTRFLNQTAPPSPQPSNQPTQLQHQQRPCEPRGSPRGDTFLPSHPGGEACVEPESPLAAGDAGEESGHHKGMIQIPVAQTSRSVKVTTPLTEAFAQARNTSTTVTSNDPTVKVTKSPQEKAAQTFTLSTMEASRVPITTTQRSAIISPNQTRAAISRWREMTESSQQKSPGTTQRAKNRPRETSVKTLPRTKSNSVSAASKKPNQSGNLLCRHLKDLDNCPHKIPPFERRYGYYNNESKSIYHCDCTHRLSGHIRHLKDAKTIQTLLQDHVSLLCFGLQSSKYCSKSTRCSAVVFPATGLLVALRKMDDGGGVIKQQRPKRYKRRTPVLLFKRCVKILQSKLT